MTHPLTKKEQAIIELLKAGGREKELALLDFMHKLGDKFDETVAEVKKNTLDLDNVLASIRGQDGKTPTERELRALIEPLMQEYIMQMMSRMNTVHEQMQANMDAHMSEMSTEHKTKMAKIQEKIDSVRDEEKIVQDVLSQIKQPEQQAVILEGPEEIRNKLELLQGDERLDKKAIRGLEETLAEVSKKASSRVQTPAKAYRVYPKDVSSQCNGSNKTFSIGGTHFGIIGVYSTQSPVIFRPIIDYTETATGFTLTAAVSAPATGQSLTCQFLK